MRNRTIGNQTIKYLGNVHTNWSQRSEHFVMKLPKKRVLAPVLCTTYLGFYVLFARQEIIGLYMFIIGVGCFYLWWFRYLISGKEV